MGMVEQQKRQIAYKVRIKDVLTGEYIKEEGWTPNYVLSGDKKLSRVNIVATVISKDLGEGLNSVTLEDGTGRITAREFEDSGQLGRVEVGEVVLVIGRPREYGQERYLLPEIMKKIQNYKWIMVRQLELGPIEKTKPTIEEQEKEVAEEPELMKPSEKMFDERIIEYIRKKDEGEGAELDEFLKQEEGKKQVELLLKEGEIFEVKPGRYKVLE